jgi:hypothetical protein
VTSEGTGLEIWHDTYGVLQWAEIQSCLGAWIESTKPAFGPEASQNFDLVKSLDRRRVKPAAQRREEDPKAKVVSGSKSSAVHADDAGLGAAQGHHSAARAFGHW